MSKSKLKSLLHICDLSSYMGISISTLDRMQADGLLIQPDYHLGKRGIRAWEEHNFLTWLKSTQSNPKKVT